MTETQAKTLTLLKEADEIVNGDRQEAYGHPCDNWAKTASLMSSYLGRPVGVTEAIGLMLCVKVARLRQSPNHRDTWRDIAGYCAVWERAHQRELEIRKNPATATATTEIE